MNEDLRVSEELRKDQVAQNPVWKEYHQLNDRMVDKKLGMRDAMQQMLRLAAKMLDAADNREQEHDMIEGLEQMASDMLLIYPEFQNVYGETEEGRIIQDMDTILFTVDEAQQYLNKLKERLRLYLETQN